MSGTNDYERGSGSSKRGTRKGTRPNDSKKPPVIGSGRNRPAKGFDPVTKTWNQLAIKPQAIVA